MSPAISSRCPRTASRRWLWVMRSSASSVPSSTSPARGPFTIATATARLRVTTGPGETRSSTSYRARICGQSVSAALGASSWTAAMAACIWYGPTGAVPRVPGEERHPFLDVVTVPQVTSLFSERDDVAVRVRAGGSPSIGQKHQGEQTGGFALCRHQLVEQARQADGLGGQVGSIQPGARARQVALVEDQVEDVKHDPQAVGPLWLRREVESHARALDALLGPADALGHGGFGNQEGVSDFGGRQPPDGAKRERQLRGHGQRGVA